MCRTWNLLEFLLLMLAEAHTDQLLENYWHVFSFCFDFFNKTKLSLMNLQQATMRELQMALRWTLLVVYSQLWPFHALVSLTFPDWLHCRVLLSSPALTWCTTHSFPSFRLCCTSNRLMMKSTMWAADGRQWEGNVNKYVCMSGTICQQSQSASKVLVGNQSLHGRDVYLPWDCWEDWWTDQRTLHWLTVTYTHTHTHTR